jgi:hypothetical protein
MGLRIYFCCNADPAFWKSGSRLFTPHRATGRLSNFYLALPQFATAWIKASRSVAKRDRVSACVIDEGNYMKGGERVGRATRELRFAIGPR